MGYCPDERCKFWREPEPGLEKDCQFPWWDEEDIKPEDQLCKLCGDRREDFDDSDD